MRHQPDEVIIRQKGALHYPRDWGKWSSAAGRGASPDALGLACRHASLNRFAARFRAARAFGGLILSDYSPEVAAGYSASVHLFLTYAAFDGMCRAKGCKPHEAGAWLDPHVRTEVTQEVRSLDERDRVMRASLPHLNSTLAPKIDRYLAGHPSSILVPVMALRHLIVHGVLTPSVNGADPVRYARICELLSQSLLDGLDAEFSLLVSRVPFLRTDL